tara:strand:- start:914 stop:1174 length:261 start_codon:yes stop_codon:yes gene_type:complete
VAKDKKSKSPKSPYLGGLKEIKTAADGGKWVEPGEHPLEFNMSDIPAKQWEQIFGKKRIEKLDEEIKEKKKPYEKDVSKKTRCNRK